ncbi:hypothetical protein JHK87_031154 [Glycine soja]|nr:hypothetical protein JHK87_031154 [Glycine soja]
MAKTQEQQPHPNTWNNSKPPFPSLSSPSIHSFLYLLFFSSFSHQKMANINNIAALKLQLYNHIRSMHDEGVVNQQFLQLQVLRQPFRCDIILRLVTTYCNSCKDLFSSLSHQLDQERVNYERLNDLALDFYARTSSIGAEGVRRACASLIEACERKDKNGCSLALYWTKNRFSYLRGRFETLVKMERNIIYLENML